MAWDKEHIRRLLHEVGSTKGRESARKAQELLDYVTRNANQEARVQETSLDGQGQPQPAR